MRLRNWKETVEPTIIDTLNDVHPHTLEENFYWYAEAGTPVWVFAGEGRYRKWRQGTILGNDQVIVPPMGPMRKYEVAYTYKRQRVKECFTPGAQWEMKPDTPEVRALLREAGVFC